MSNPSASHWVSLTDTTGFTGFTLSLFSNIILLSLITFRSNKQIGSYKYVLILFCCFTLFYSCVEMMIRPLIHNQDDTLFLIHRKWFNFDKTVTRVISTMYCFCYALSFTLFALQFLYRYIATCKPYFLQYFSGSWFFFWFLGSVAIALSWQIAAFFLFPQNERTEQSFKLICETVYGIDYHMSDYMPYKYFYRDEFNSRHPDVQNMMGIVQHLLVIFGSFSVLFYCGFKTWSTMQSMKGVSKKTRQLQYQLFRALVFQTCLPMFFMYTPTGFMFSCPFFGIELRDICNYQTVIAQLYPGVDPMIVLLLINDYRNAILSIIGLEKLVKHKSSISQTVSSRVTATQID